MLRILFAAAFVLAVSLPFTASAQWHVAAAEVAYAEVLDRDYPELLQHYRAGIQHGLLPDGPQMDRLTITEAGFSPL